MMHPGRRFIQLGLLLLDLWLAIAVCSCCGVISNVRAKPTAESPQAAVIISPEPTETAVPPTSTPRPPTPTLRSATATTAPAQSPSLIAAEPTQTPQTSSSSALGGLVAIPNPGAAFDIEVTQEQINEYLAGKTYEAQGVVVKEVQVVLTGQEILCTLHATQQQTKLSAGISVRGVPSVADGKAYFKVNDVTLDNSIKGFARLLAQAAIDEAIKRYSTPQGIPVPAENVEFESIKLMPGKIRVAGRTR